MTSHNFKNSQISIFILIGILAILFFIILIFTSISDNKDNIDNTKNEISSLDPTILPIKEHVDLCVEKQLKRALIISGIKGGFIYNFGEYYGPSVIPENTYNEQIIEGWNINRNSLLFNVLIHAQTEVFTPRIEGAYVNTINGVQSEVYGYGIREEYNRFILEEFYKCIDMDIYEENGFEVIYPKYLGQVVNSGSEGTLRVNELDGEVGDKIEIRVEGALVEGEIITVNEDNSVIVSFDKTSIESVNLNSGLDDWWALNKDLNVTVNTTFASEEVSANMRFPVTIIGNDFESSYVNSYVSTNVRFDTLLDLSGAFLNSKYDNRSIDFLDEEDISYIMRSRGFSNIDNLDEIELFVTTVNNTEHFKRYILSFVDYNSKILGSPYVFNVGYENEAPKIDFVNFGVNDYNDNSATIFIAKNHPINIDLKKYTSDKQAIDNYRSYFLEDSYDGADAIYNLDSDGNLYFKSFMDKKYTFKVGITDGETIRNYNFIFVSGFPDNSNNTLANECLSFKNYPAAGFFPINDNFRDKLFSYEDSNGNNKLFGYSLYMQPSDAIKYSLPYSEITFDESCLISYDLYGVEASLKNLEGGNVQEIEFDYDTSTVMLPIVSYPLELSLKVYEKTSKRQMTQEYTASIYPSSCLGPDKASGEDASLYGGELSCCDTSVIYDSIENNDPKNFAKNSILDVSGKQAMNADVYFCADIPELATNPNIAYSGAHSNKVLWEEVSQYSTSLLRGSMSSVCDGTSAIGRVDSISSSSPVVNAFVQGVGVGPSKVANSFSATLGLQEKAEACEFCYIKDRTPYVIYIGNDFVLTTGLVSKNSNGNSGVGYLPHTYNGRSFDEYIMCDDSWYGSSTGGNSVSEWVKGYSGANGDPGIIYKSKGYCSNGINLCGGRKYSPTYNYAYDIVEGVCEDYYISSSGSFVKQLNSGWVCSDGSVCSNGICS